MRIKKAQTHANLPHDSLISLNSILALGKKGLND
jgi:hypothetical protein